MKLTYEELATILVHVEACPNSRPWIPTNLADQEGLEDLTPGHFLIGRPLCALPDPATSINFMSMATLSEHHQAFLAEVVI